MVLCHLSNLIVGKEDSRRKKVKNMKRRESLVVQWLGFGTLTAGSLGLIPGHGTKILQAAHPGQKKKKKRRKGRGTEKGKVI